MDDTIKRLEVGLEPVPTGTPSFKLKRLNVLADADTLGDHGVDVVFVHGLTGDPLRTWDMVSSGANPALVEGWIADLARRLAGRATIWTAGYDAPLLASPRSPASIYEQGRQAISAFAHAGIGRRKVVFAAHSLGGILIKAALHAAEQSAEASERDVVLRTFGVVFIGTPHAGSALTRWRSVIPLVTKAAASGLGGVVSLALGAYLVTTTVVIGSMEWTVSSTLGAFAACLAVPALGYLVSKRLGLSDHVLALDPDNPALYDLTIDFRRIAARREFPTRAFFEQRPMLLFFTAVPRASADPGVTDCLPVGIDANHVQMCKSQASEQISGTLAGLVARARRGVDAPVFADFVRSDECNPAMRQQLDLFRMGRDAFHRRFADIVGDRRGAEAALRMHVRDKLLQHATFPTAQILELAQQSDFDLDIFIWCLVQERIALQAQHRLRTRAMAAMSRWENEFAQPRPSLIGFYRTVRTLEHLHGGDLSELSGDTESEALLGIIEDARRQLESKCVTVFGEIEGRTWRLDGDAGTRRLLLRLWCSLRAAQAARRFVEQNTNDRHEDPDLHRVRLLALRGRFDAALAQFVTALADAKAGGTPGQ